jgi:hypothetical protein
MASSRKRRGKERPAADALAQPMDTVERRQRGKALLRVMLLRGTPHGEAVGYVMNHPDLAANPPSQRTVETWLADLRRAPGRDFIDDDVRAMVAHPMQHHRQAQLAALWGRIERHNLNLSRIAEQLAAAIERDDRDAEALLRAEMREEDKRVHDAWAQHAKITGIDARPLEAHLSEPEARARLVASMVKNPNEFDTGELRTMIAAFAEVVAKREQEFEDQQPDRIRALADLGLRGETPQA